MAKVSPANTHKQSTLALSLSLSLLQEALASHPSQNLASSWALPDLSATSLRLVHHGPDTVSAWLPSTPFRSRKVAMKEGSDGRRDMSPSTERRSHRRLSAAPVPWPLHSVARPSPNDDAAQVSPTLDSFFQTFVLYSVGGFGKTKAVKKPNESCNSISSR